MRLQLILAVILLHGCKAADVAQNFESCEVPQSDILTDPVAEYSILHECEATTSGHALLKFGIYSDGTACAGAYDDNGEIFQSCERTWTRPTCINVVIENQSASTSFNIDYINPGSPDGFNANITYTSPDETFTYAYRCTKVQFNP
tara:strand:+ start:4542 stop:4979 length:438 start_codon:yes stop_codon:yes gene_type:complete